MPWVLRPLEHVRLMYNPGQGWCGDFTLIALWHLRAGGPCANHGNLNLQGHPPLEIESAIELRRQARHFPAEKGVQEVLRKDGSKDWDPE